MDEQIFNHNINELTNFCVPVTSRDFAKNRFLDDKYKETIIACDLKQKQVKVVSDIRSRDDIKIAIRSFSFKSNSNFKCVETRNVRNDCLLKQDYVCQGRSDVADKKNSDPRFVFIF